MNLRMNLKQALACWLAWVAQAAAAATVGIPDLATMPDTLPTGRWTGMVRMNDPSPRLGEIPTQVMLTLTHCPGQARLWQRDAQGRLQPLGPTGSVASFHGSHVLFGFSGAGQEDGPVEAVLWTFIEVGVERLDARMVRTLDHPVDERRRSEGQSAWGRFSKVSDDCTPGE
jgi:hypothetical protein